jgi:hypothetical protein
MFRTIALRAEQGHALVRLLGEDGATAAGEVPADHVASLLDAEEPGAPATVADAHARGEPPPADPSAPGSSAGGDGGAG